MKNIPIILLILLTAVPMGLPVLSSCDLWAFFGVESHHHEGLASAIPCTQEEEHHDEEKVPCGEDCAIELPDASRVRLNLRVPAVAVSALPVWSRLHVPYSLIASTHAVQDYSPPGGSCRPSLPSFTGCFLI